MQLNRGSDYKHSIMNELCWYPPVSMSLRKYRKLVNIFALVNSSPS